MALSWVRSDTNIASHDNILDLLGYEHGRGSALSYLCALAYSGFNGTDGHIPFAALPFIHASKKDMQALVEVGLMAPNPKGWTVRNYTDRQQSSTVTEEIRSAQS